MNQTPPKNKKITVEKVNHMTIRELIASLEIAILDKAFENRYSSQLEKRIYIFKVTCNGNSWDIRRTIEQFETLEKDVINNSLYSFFKKKKQTTKFTTEAPEEIHKILLAFIKITLSYDNVPQCLYDFLEISSLDLPLKIKGGYMLKKKGGRPDESMAKGLEIMVCTLQKRYFIITQQALLFTKESNDSRIRECLSFDSRFEFQHGKSETGEHNKIIIEFSQRRLQIKAEDIITYIDFVYSLHYAIKTSPYTKIHRFGSFAPMRLSSCKWYVDGIDYFSDVCDAIKLAKETVYITDWWLSPEVYLKRPVDLRDFAKNNLNNQTRLDSILKAAANRGVIVLVLVYNAPTMALNLDTKHTKKTLESLSQNITVVTHPDQGIPKLYSHHEKMVLIDQTIGFMGGLDLCFGRWDTQEHLLFDQHSLNETWPQIDFSNSRIRDFFDVKNYQKTLLLNHEPRMPWHDIAIQIRGDSAIDLARHFTQYWNHATIQQYGKLHKKVALMHTRDIKIEEYKSSEQNNSEIIFKSKQQTEIPLPQQYIIHQISTKEIYEENSTEIIQEESNNHQSFIKFMEQQQQKIEQKHNNQQLTLDEINDEDEELDENEEFKFVEETIKKPQKNKQTDPSNQRPFQSPSQPKKDRSYFISKLIPNEKKYSCITQLSRSSCIWATGIRYKEHSIQNAYLQLINESKNFIYIENQFFISSTAEGVKNLVAKCLVQRIIRAHNNNEKFKVIVFLPLLPGFEGEIDQNNSAVLKVQLHWEYQTISRGGTSIMEQLKNKGIDPKEYISFFSLRQHSMSPPPNSIPVTEIIYIHSKLMIIDDEVALIGSANINDRSLKGNRDSELAIIVQDQSRINSIMNGQYVKVAKFAHTLRIAIFMEHFGLTEDQVKDPLNNDFLTEIRQRTTKNTNIYREIFACYPDDQIERISDYGEFKKFKDLSKYEELRFSIKGHAVLFPLNFLQNEDLKVKVLSKEYLVPDKSFT